MTKTTATRCRVQPNRKSLLENKNTSLRVRVLLCVLLALAVVLIYAQVRHFDQSHLDDPDYVFRNSHVRGGLTLANIAYSLTTFDAANWHPVTWWSHMLDVQLFGFDPGMHHVTNVAIHIINAWLLFLILATMTGSTWRSAFVAALFAVHPINVESVAWIAERKNVLSTTFWLLTIWAYFIYVRRGGVARYLLLLVTFAIGLAAKPMLVTLPIVLILLDIWPIARQDSLRVRSHVPKIPLFVMAALSSWVTVVAQGRGNAILSFDPIPLGQRAANALVASVSYLWKLIWPSELCVMYTHPQATLPILATVGCGLLLLAITLFSFCQRKRRPYLIVGWLWFLITLIPVIGLVQVGAQAMADRYAYVTLIGPFIAIAWLVPDIAGPRRAKWLALPFAVGLMALGLVASNQTGYWRNADTLFEHAVAVTGCDGPAFYMRVDMLAKGGRPGAAFRSLQNALEVSGVRHVVRDKMGRLLAEKGLVSEAIDQYRLALKIKPDYAITENNLGVALARLHRLDEAEQHLRRAIELHPRYADALHSLGVVLYWQGRREEAIAEWKRALEINPGMEDTRKRLKEAESRPDQE